jgi:hypothetical protein
MADADDLLGALERIEESLGASRDLMERATRAHHEFCETVLKLLKEQQSDMEFRDRKSDEAIEYLSQIAAMVSYVAGRMFPAALDDDDDFHS